MTVFRAFFQGIARVALAPSVLGGVFLVTVLMALPLGLVLRSMIAEHLGASEAAARVLSGADHEWWQEFSAQASGLGRTFTPTIIGFAGVLDNISGILDHRPPPLVLASALGAYLLVWLFLSGGIIDRYARHRRLGAHGFFAAAGTFFFRFLRLGLVGLLVYGAIFTYVHSWLFDDLYEWLTRDVPAERLAFGIRMGLYAVFGTLLIACNLLFDYARIRAVVEDRRSMIGALLAALRFLLRRPAAILLYVLNGTVLILILVLYANVAPGTTRPGLAMWTAFLLMQVYILARLAGKLLFYASQTVFFQSELAHASYVAAPVPSRPEPAVSEAIGLPPVPIERDSHS